jgi:hypothetical protein
MQSPPIALNGPFSIAEMSMHDICSSLDNKFMQAKTNAIQAQTKLSGAELKLLEQRKERCAFYDKVESTRSKELNLLRIQWREKMRTKQQVDLNRLRDEYASIQNRHRQAFEERNKLNLDAGAFLPKQLSDEELTEKFFRDMSYDPERNSMRY